MKNPGKYRGAGLAERRGTITDFIFRVMMKTGLSTGWLISAGAPFAGLPLVCKMTARK
jgi:hypothetical protein